MFNSTKSTQFVKAQDVKVNRQFRYSFLAQTLRLGVIGASGSVGIGFGFLYLVAPGHFNLLVKKCTGIDLSQN